MLFAVCWLGQLISQIIVVSQEAVGLGVPFQWNEFWPAFGQATLENWQGAFLGAFSFVILATFLVSRGSPHSRDRYDTMQETLERMEDRVDAIHFQLFEERTQRTEAERFFDERRRDPDYDQAYRQTWRALLDAATLDDDEDPPRV